MKVWGYQLSMNWIANLQQNSKIDGKYLKNLAYKGNTYCERLSCHHFCDFDKKDSENKKEYCCQNRLKNNDFVEGYWRVNVSIAAQHDYVNAWSSKLEQRLTVHNIYLFEMLNRSRKMLILAVLLTITLSMGKQCLPGEVQKGQICLNCRLIKNTREIGVEATVEINSCRCNEGFFWSEVLLQCLPQIGFKKPIRTYSNQDSLSFNIDSQNRLLAATTTLTCNTAQGFVLYNKVCANCRVFPYALGVAISSTKCGCIQSYYGFPTCSCSWSEYFNAKTTECSPCSAIADTTQRQNCNNCNFPFMYSYYGCVNCYTLSNNAGPIATSYSTCCLTGYTFEWTLGICKCDNAQGYAIGPNGACGACASNDNNCLSCVKTYLSNGFSCVHGSTIPNYNITSYACNTGYVYKYDIASNKLISCACSTASASYLKGTTCTQCASSLPSGVTLTNCKACAASSGFYNGTVECIYCPGVLYSPGTATANGCDCNANYYWNMNTDQCECDFNLGLIGGSISNCINCLNIPNTAQTIIPTACSCLKGFIWNPTTNTCDCDTNSPSVFQQGGVCINCATIVGSTGKLGADGHSCLCITNYFWNAGTNKCQCDSNQNFAVFGNGYCSDCLSLPRSNGLGYAQQCVCLYGLSWNPTTFTCVCPSGSVIIGAACTSCSIATLPATATVADCQACSASKGFATQNGVCVLCSSQLGTSSTVSASNTCTCSNTTGQIWNSQLGGCVCDWNQYYVTYLKTDGTFKCVYCPYVWSSGACACGFSLLLQNSFFNICTNIQQDPNAVKTTNYACKTGYTWSEASFPFKCVPGYTSGAYMVSSQSGFSYYLCTSLATAEAQNACSICNAKYNFLFLTGTQQCLYCKNVTNSTGLTTSMSACGCITGTSWNPVTLTCDFQDCSKGLLYNPNTKVCDICDPIHSVMVGSNCYDCMADLNSNGFAASATSCACLDTFTWDGSSCSSGICVLETSIWIGSICFKCPTTNSGTGVPDISGTLCGCSHSFTWQSTATGGSCVCNPSTSVILASGDCLVCPTNANSTGLINPNGGCLCNNNYIWDGTTATNCICDDSVHAFITTSGTCFQCLRINDPNFDGTTNNGACNCLNDFTFTPNANGNGGSCTCLAPSVIMTTGKCLACPNNANTTGSPNSSGGCACYNSYIWDGITAKNCICDDSVNAIITTSGICFLCLMTKDPNFDETITNGLCNCKNGFTFNSTATGGNCICSSPNVLSSNICQSCPTPETNGPDQNGGCLCNNNFVWDPKTSTCLCDSTVSGFVLPNGTCFQCISSIDNNFDGTIINGGCHCRNGFTFQNNDSGISCQCLPLATAFVTASGVCFTCPFDKVTPGTPNGKGGCNCLNNYVWNTTTLKCVCSTTTSVILANGTCFVCGTAGTYTNTTRVSSTTCKCAASNLTWSNSNGYCDCGSKAAMVITGNSYTCITCSKANSDARADSFTCDCGSTLMWNIATKQCDCGLTAVYIVGNKTCLPCNFAIYANGLNISKPTACNCAISAMTWSTTAYSCGCNSTSVIFNNNWVFSCVGCSSAIYAKSKFNATSCNCVSSSFSWVANKGCVCTDPNALPMVTGTTYQCVVCNSIIYSSGFATSGGSCICLGTLTWNNKTFTCGCNTSSVVTNVNGQYTCTPCTITNNAKATVTNNQCTCVVSTLVWYPQGYCGCSIPQTQVYIGSGSKTTCVTCNSTINSNGKTSPSSNTCSCVSSALTFNNGVCDCGNSSAFIVTGLVTYTCVNCSNSALFLKNKVSSSSCGCTSTNLTWDGSTGSCKCSNASQIIVGTGTTASCKGCTGQYSLTPNSSTTCSCLGIGLVFTVSKTASGACACPKNNVLLPTFTCLLCPNNMATITPYECNCSTGSFWNGLTQTCQVCTTITNAAKGTILACNCTSGFVWDVMTYTCIKACTAADSTCMTCNFPSMTGAPAIALGTPAASLTGASSIISLLNATYTNYNKIKGYQCPCITGYSWDSVRLRCYDSQLI